VAGKKKDFSELHNGIINELTGVERARGELHVALVPKFKTLTLGQLSTQLKALTDEGKLAQRQRLELGDKRDMQLAARSLHAGQLVDDAIVKLTEVFLFSCHSRSPWFGVIGQPLA
jgi:hypothetical protein